MRVRTRLNRAYIKEDLLWQLKTNVHQVGLKLAEEGKLSANYLGQVLNDEIDVRLSTIDAIHNVLADRFVELGQTPPDDLWQNLIVHERV